MKLNSDPTLLDECGLNKVMQDVLLTSIRRKFTFPLVKIQAKIECACYEYAGVDAVKEALKSGLEMSRPARKIQINLIVSPIYSKCSLLTFS